MVRQRAAGRAEALSAARGGHPEPDLVLQGTEGATGRQILILDDFPDPAVARTLSPNGRAHWAARRRVREQVEMVVGSAIFEQRLSDALAGCPVRITYRWVMPDRRRRDLDNHSTGVVKVVQDCLARLGLIAADDASCVVAIDTQIVVERGRRALEIVVEPAAGPAEQQEATR